LSVGLRAAAPALADVRSDAVAVAGALGDAGSLGAAVGRAGAHAGRAAAAQAVTGARRVQSIAAARRGNADRLGGVDGASADPVAGARLSAGGVALIVADPPRIIVAGVDRPAGAQAPDLIAGRARAVAADVAADAVGAEPRRAIAVLGADRAARLGPAASVHAGHAVDAVSVGLAGHDAGARHRVAGERRADGGRSRLAVPGPVADVRVDHRVAVAGALLADRSGHVIAASAAPVAFPVQTAAGSVRGRAVRHVARRAAGGDERAGARRALRVARHALVSAGRAATDAVDAETATALAGAAAGVAGLLRPPGVGAALDLYVDGPVLRI